MDESGKGVSIENLLSSCSLLKMEYDDFPELHSTVTESVFNNILNGTELNLSAAKVIIDKNRTVLSIVDEEILNLATKGVDFTKSYPWTLPNVHNDDLLLRKVYGLSRPFIMLHLRVIYKMDAMAENSVNFSVFSQFLDKYMSGRGVLSCDLINALPYKIRISFCNKQRNQHDGHDIGDGHSYWETVKTNMKRALWNDRLEFWRVKHLILKGDFLYKENMTWCQYLAFLKAAIEDVDSGDFSKSENLYKKMKDTEHGWLSFISPNKNGNRLLRSITFDVKVFYERIRKKCIYDPNDELWNSHCHYEKINAVPIHHN
jgi:hypothetical protein